MLSHEKRRPLLLSKLIYKIPATNGLPRNIFFQLHGISSVNKKSKSSDAESKYFRIFNL